MDVPMGINSITDVLCTSPILNGDEDGINQPGGGPSAAGQFSDYGGVNPDLDPELALALKVSLEE